MSKYQNTLDVLAEIPMGRLGGETCEFTGQQLPSEDITLADCFPAEFNLLQELVDKTIPKKIAIHKEHGYYICPTCGGNVVSCTHLTGMYVFHVCQECQQRLDWTDAVKARHRR